MVDQTASTLETSKQNLIEYVQLQLGDQIIDLELDPAHYEAMLTATPPWERLWTDHAWASQLVHVGNYIDLLRVMKPDTIPRMAAFISVIRPGKAHLQTRPWTEVFAEVWDGDESQGYTFKKSHAISYAALVALHMNLLSGNSQNATSS